MSELTTCLANTLTVTEPMKEASEDEQPEDFALKVDKEQPPSKSRSEREEDLRRMMEDDGLSALNRPS